MPSDYVRYPWVREDHAAWRVLADREGMTLAAFLRTVRAALEDSPAPAPSPAAAPDETPPEPRRTPAEMGHQPGARVATSDGWRTVNADASGYL